MKEKKSKLLAGFFIIMIFFTFLSKITDALTVGKVQIDTLKQDELTFKISGIAKVKEKKRQKVKPKEGYIIKDINVKKGEKVKKGQLLFAYDLKKIREEKKQLEHELKKLKLNAKKVQLGKIEAGEETDLESLLSAKKYAKKQLSRAKRKVGSVKETVREEKEKLWKEKNQQLETALAENEDAKKELELETKKADRVIYDKETILQQLKEPIKDITDLIDSYKYSIVNKNYTKIEEDKYNIFNYYYDGNYQNHLKELETAQRSYERAIEDKNDMEAKWKEIIDPQDQYDEDEAVKEQYKANIRARKEERKAAERAIEDANELYNSLKKKDSKLNDMLYELRLLLEQNPNSAAVDEKENELLVYLSKGKIKESLEIEIKNAETEIARAKEDKEDIIKNENNKIARIEKQIKELQEEKEKIEHDLDKIKNKTYNYRVDLEETEELILEKEKALEDIELQIETVKKGLAKQKNSEDKNRKINQLELDTIQVDMEEKIEKINEAAELLQKDGAVYSPMNGKILSISFEKENTITSEDELLLSVKGFELTASVGKDELKYYDKKDEIIIEIDERNKLLVFIEDLKKPDKSGSQTFTMNIPDTLKDIKAGDSFAFSGTKQSTSYQQCVNLGALKEDSKGTYVLIIQSKESVLGKEEIAVRRNVTILEQDSEKAALECDISREEKIIIGSNKNISIGDRVRMEESK